LIGNDASISDVLFHYALLMKHTEEERERLRSIGDGDHYIQLVEGCEAMLAKLQKYLSKSEANPVYIAATVCDPRYNFFFIKHIYKKTPERLLEIEQKLRAYFETFRDKSGDRIDELGETYTAQSEPEWVSMLREPSKRATTENRATTFGRPGDSEFRSYIELACLVSKESSVPKYWADHRHEYPTWWKMWQYLASIPASSAEVERIFSRSDSLSLRELILAQSRR
jgi:hypothetical protein